MFNYCNEDRQRTRTKRISLRRKAILACALSTLFLSQSTQSTVHAYTTGTDSGHQSGADDVKREFEGQQQRSNNDVQMIDFERDSYHHNKQNRKMLGVLSGATYFGARAFGMDHDTAHSTARRVRDGKSVAKRHKSEASQHRTHNEPTNAATEAKTREKPKRRNAIIPVPNKEKVPEQPVKKKMSFKDAANVVRAANAFKKKEEEEEEDEEDEGHEGCCG
jgi:hypothetical protein